MPDKNTTIAVVGIGNNLLTDDGAGIHTLTRFEESNTDDDVDCLDGGTVGLALLDRLSDLGGIIAPGIGVSAQALWHHAAQLPRIDVCEPKEVIGRNTVTSMQAGLYYGYVGLVDGIVARIRQAVDFPVAVIATGGLADLIHRGSSRIATTRRR